MDNFTCKICGEKCIVAAYKVKEMYFGTKDEFTYYECGDCGCLQISVFPENVASYYPENYYSKKKVLREKYNKIFDFF